MFDRLLGLIVKATNIQPHYTPEHCLVVTRAVGGCSLCHDVCPHEAITIKRQVSIDPIDCTGCGLCVQACPSQALESSSQYQAGVPLKCSQVSGSAQSVQCLSRLQASDVLRLAGKGQATLVRNDCASCRIGGAQVLPALETLSQKAQSLAQARGQAFKLEIHEAQHYDTSDNPATLSRRDMLRGSWKGVQRSAADVLAPLDPGPSKTEKGAPKALPKELQRQYRALELAELPTDAQVPWPLPRVEDGCIMCPVCTNVCPTGAFQREHDPIQLGRGGTLWLEPARCNGCDACVRSCPVKVIHLENPVTWGEVSGGRSLAYKRDANQAAALGIGVARRQLRATEASENQAEATHPPADPATDAVANSSADDASADAKMASDPPADPEDRAPG